jgi:hypothetical protein
MRNLLLLILGTSVFLIPVSAEITLSGDDAQFLTDVTTEGLPLLYVIPATMKAGIFHGDDNAITGVGQEQTAALEAFLAKINGYSLSDQVKPLRDRFVATGEMYKKDLAEYSTLNKSCGSCISKMNEMYPKLMDEAKNTSVQVISFYQTTLAPIS